MKRTGFLRRVGIGALAVPVASVFSSTVSVETEEAAEDYHVAYQFGQIEDGTRLIRVSEKFDGEPTFEAMKKAGLEFFNHVWRYVYRDGIRHVDSMVIHR